MLPTPPKWLDTLLEFICADRFIDELQGDLHELFYRNLEEHGPQKAKWKYLWSVLFAVRIYRLPAISQFIPTTMWNLHFLLAFRYAKRHKVYSMANLIGLCLGLAATFYIGFFIKHELAYDNFHEHKTQLYRVLKTDPPTGQKSIQTSSQHGASLANEFSHIKLFRMGNDPVKIGKENPIMVDDFYWADSTLLEMFSFKLLKGSSEHILNSPNSIILTRSLSEQLFGDEDPVGKTTRVKVYDSDVDIDMEITGIIEDPPANSHIQFKALGSMANAEQMYERLVKHWGFNWLRTYVQISEEHISEVNKYLPAVIEKYGGEGLSERMGIELQPFDEVYLYSQSLGGNKLTGDIRQLYIFGTIGFLILLISIFNYINLSTAQAIRRAREVGIRKVVGSKKGNIMLQFLTESVLYSLLAGVIGAGLVSLLLPSLNQLLALELSFGLITVLDGLLVLGGLIGIGLVAGLFPAIKMSGFGFSALGAVQSHFRKENRGFLRHGLIGIQYVISLVLLTASLVIYLQYNYLKNYDLGFDREQLIHIPVEDRQLQEKIMLMKAQYLGLSDVKGATATGENLPAKMNNTWTFAWQGADPEQRTGIDIVSVDQDYFSLLGIEFVEGQNFLHGYEVDSARTFILNESAKSLTGKSSLAGELITVNGRERRVEGVVKNHHFTSLHSTIPPVGYAIFPPGIRVSADNLFLKVDTKYLSELLTSMEEIWNEFSPDPFEYNFVDEAFAQTYKAEQQFTALITAFTILGIGISILGLFGLMSFVIKHRMKEISIRKVLGAGTWHVLKVLSGRLLVVFATAFIIATPIAYYFLHDWLANYPYHIELSISMPLIAACCCIFVSGLVILYHIRQTFRLNPADILRTE